MLPNIESPPGPATRRLADATGEPSPSPWDVDVFYTECGAVRLLDNRGNTIGWATDAMGHTLDPAIPTGRHPDDIVLNAKLMALGPETIMLCRLIRGAFTVYRMQQATLDLFVDPKIEEAFDRAGGILRRAGGQHDVP